MPVITFTSSTATIMNSRILPLAIIGLLAAASFCTLLAGGGPEGSDLAGDDTTTLLMLLLVGMIVMLALARFIPPILQNRRHRKAERLRELQQMQHSPINQ